MFLLKTALLAGVAMAALAGSAKAEILIQCPGDTKGVAVIDKPDANHPNAKCMSLAAGDGFITLADGIVT